MVLLIILKSEKLHKTSTFKLLAVGSVNDLICCFASNLQAFTNSFFNLQLAYQNLFFCSWISVFLQTTSLVISSWMQVSISLDRLLTLTIKKWSKQYFRGFRPFIYAALLIFIIVAIFFNFVFTGGYSFYVNATEIVVCYQNPPNSFPWYKVMSQVYVYFGFIVPYALLLVSNLAIIFKATKFERDHVQPAEAGVAVRRVKRKAKMTRTVLIITFLYILSTLPSIICLSYFFLDIIYLDAGQLILNILGNIQFSYEAFNFLILFLSNKMFAREAKSILFCANNSNDVSVTPRNQLVNEPNPTRNANKLTYTD